MIRVNLGEILTKARYKYTLVIMSTKAERELIQEECDERDRNQTKPKDAYAIKDSSKYLSEAVKGIEEGKITLK